MTEILDESAVSEIEARKDVACRPEENWQRWHDLILWILNTDIPALCATIRAGAEELAKAWKVADELRANPRQVWEEHPNRDHSGNKCTECGFDNRFHAYECFFHHPSLKISEDAFNTLHDEKMRLQSQLEQLRAENQRLRELVRHMQFPRGE